ncbi:hypothetical protein P8452_34248 [Trifolium repens]|nr:hypothetical protein P8452_34248 [Trifolium repens]
MFRNINYLIDSNSKSNVTCSDDLKFPNNLKLLYWDCFPQRSLPQNFWPEDLIVVEMRNSHLEQLWERDQVLPNLKRLDLSYSSKLIALPDLSFSPNIEEVHLSGCESLTQVNSSCFLKNLNLLLLEGCTELKSINIPSNILSRSYGFVGLRYCHNLETLLISSRIDHVVQSYKSFYGYSMVQVTQNFSCEMGIELQLNDEGDYEIWESFSDTLSRKRINEFCWLDFRILEELPSSLHLLVGLEELNLQGCTKLKTIPSSIGNLRKLLKLNLAFCESLETFPSSIFKLKLTKLDFHGCSMLATFPEILEPAESFTRIDLTGTAIKELPSSLHLLAGLEELILRGCTKFKTIPSSIGNLSKLLKLDLANCKSLETFPSSIFKLNLTKLDFPFCSMLGTFPEIPNDIGCLSSLTELSLKGSSIVHLPESLAHLSSLKSLDLSDCKLLECVPKLPPNLNQVLAYDCPSIKIMMLNSRSDSEKGSFKFHLTNSQELDATSLSNIEDEAYIKINGDAYRSVLFCYPGSAVPDWFYHRCQGHSITIRNDHLNFYGRNRLIGFALCVVLGPDFPYTFSWLDVDVTYELKFECDGQTHFHPIKLEFECDDYFIRFAQNHTFLSKYELTRIGNWPFRAETMTFEIVSFPKSITVKECGICPLYSKEPSGDAVCSVDPGAVLCTKINSTNMEGPPERRDDRRGRDRRSPGEKVVEGREIAAVHRKEKVE